MSIRVSTAGMTLSWALEATAGTRPTTASAYTKVPEVKSMPSFNPTPDNIDSTTLEETVYRTYVAGLKDLSGVLEFDANWTDDLVTTWNSCITDFNTGVAATPTKEVWFCVQHPKLANAVYFTGEPITIGLNEATVGGMAETTLYISVNTAPAMYAKPTSGT